MTRITALSFVGFLWVFLFVVSSASACTIFSVSDGQKVFFAGNEDQKQNKSSFLIVDKSGHFAVVYFATPWAQYSQVLLAGINEKGLCYDQNWIPKEKLIAHPERKKSMAVIRYMKECSTVEEVISRLTEENWGNTIDFQIHFADKTGDAVVIHPDKNGEMTYTRKPRGNNYLVSSNFNLRFMKEGDFLKSMSWVGWDRYNTADKMLAKIKSENTLTVKSAAAVLNAAHQESPDGSRSETVYSTLFDLQNMQIYLFYKHQFDTAYVLDVASELAKTKGRFRRTPLKDMILDQDIKREKM